MNDRDFIANQATQILAILSSISFEDCHELTRNFAEVTPRPGIYAFRHRHIKILYVGKSKNIRQRLRGGYKALGWAFIDRLNPDDVRIAAVTLEWKTWQSCLDIEARILQTAQPCYDVQIRQEE